jgi:hypothetical protein
MEMGEPLRRPAEMGTIRNDFADDRTTDQFLYKLAMVAILLTSCQEGDFDVK